MVCTKTAAAVTGVGMLTVAVSVAFSADSKLLVSGSLDGKVRGVYGLSA